MMKYTIQHRYVFQQPCNVEGGTQFRNKNTTTAIEICVLRTILDNHKTGSAKVRSGMTASRSIGFKRLWPKSPEKMASRISRDKRKLSRLSSCRSTATCSICSANARKVRMVADYTGCASVSRNSAAARELLAAIPADRRDRGRMALHHQGGNRAFTHMQKPCTGSEACMCSSSGPKSSTYSSARVLTCMLSVAAGSKTCLRSRIGVVSRCRQRVRQSPNPARNSNSHSSQ